MNIVIVGDGKVGYTLAQKLSLEGHDITMIDNDSEALGHTIESLDVMCVLGNGASLEIQKEASVQDADLLIAATSSDELNMLCCLTGKTIGAKNTIARVRNPEYEAQLGIFKEQFGLSMVINPELEAAREIARIIKFPPALKIETFSKGRVELVEFKLLPNMLIVGKKLSELPKLVKDKVLICAVDRANNIFIPDGSFVLEAGDRIHITGESRQISSFIHHIGGFSHKIRSVMIVGGGRICYYLAKMLDEKQYQIKILEKNRDRCEQLCELLPRAQIINVNASNLELLEMEGLEHSDAFVALSNMDEENLIMSMLAHQKKVLKVITKTAHFNNMNIMEKLGLDCIVNPKLITANHIIQYVRAMQNSVLSNDIITLHKLVDNKAEAIEFIAGQHTKYLGVPLSKVKTKPNLIVAMIVRQGKVIIPGGNDCIVLGDSVIVITSKHMLNCLNDIFLEEYYDYIPTI